MSILEAIVLRALAKAPDQRYGGCQELAEDFYRDHYLPPLVDHDWPQSHRFYQFFQRMYFNIKRLYVAIPLLLMVLILIFLDKYEKHPELFLAMRKQFCRK